MEIGPTHRTEPVAVSILSVQVVAEGMLFGAHHPAYTDFLATNLWLRVVR